MGSIEGLGTRDALQTNAKQLEQSRRDIDLALRQPRRTPETQDTPKAQPSTDVVTASVEGRQAANAFRANLAVLKIEDELARESLDILG